jgi:ribose transport system ATP-binding protein
MVSEAAGVGAAHGDPVKNGIPGPWVDIRGLGKHFAGEVALRDVDMDIVRGEVHGLVGANGAGKSTLIRCLAGVTVPDEGKILVHGAELRPGSPQASEKAGLAFIHQELNLVPHFSALENMLLGAPKATRLGLIDWKRSSRGARAAAERVGIRFPLEAKVSDLSVGERWLVMISKALVREASLIAMDEPTAALSGPESDQLFSIIRDLAASGVAILYVSHRLDEVLNLCDRITVFRDGEVAERATRGGLDKKGLIRAIVGHEVKGAEGRRRVQAERSGTPLFSARDVARGAAVKGVSFDLYRGEILGLGGLQRGHFEMNGKRLTIGGETQAIELGIALVPEERRSQGLMLAQSVAFNINIASLQSLRVVDILPFVSSQKMRKQAGRLIKELGVKTPSSSTKVATLSGGNQQKALIARWLRPDTKVLILDEPSRGVDIGAREEIHEAIRKLARSGVGVIVISSDVEELAVLADRIVVMREGRVVGELLGDEITEARIVEMSYHDAV